MDGAWPATTAGWEWLASTGRAGGVAFSQGADLGAWPTGTYGSWGRGLRAPGRTGAWPSVMGQGWGRGLREQGGLRGVAYSTWMGCDWLAQGRNGGVASSQVSGLGAWPAGTAQGGVACTYVVGDGGVAFSHGAGNGACVRWGRGLLKQGRFRGVAFPNKADVGVADKQRQGRGRGLQAPVGLGRGLQSRGRVGAWPADRTNWGRVPRLEGVVFDQGRGLGRGGQTAGPTWTCCCSRFFSPCSWRLHSSSSPTRASSSDTTASSSCLRAASRPRVSSASAHSSASARSCSASRLRSSSTWVGDGVGGRCSQWSAFPRGAQGHRVPRNP